MNDVRQNARVSLQKVVPVTSSEFEVSYNILLQFLDLKEKFSVARCLLREMGQNSNEEIEPMQQTILADATESVPGVLCAGVPGAGGVDAMYAIVFSSGSQRSVQDAVEMVWSSWDQRGPDLTNQRPSVCALTLEAETCIKSGVILE